MNKQPPSSDRQVCGHCANQEGLPFEFTMAFQPIVNIKKNTLFGYEALVRGMNNEPAFSIIEQVNNDNRYLFDQQCRIKAISLAAKLDLKAMLSINFLPNAVYEPQRCMRTTLEAAKKYNFPTDHIIFEFTEVEKIEDTEHVKRIVEYYSSLGFITAIDDFGAGYAGLNLLADFQTNIIKFDMALIRNVHLSKARQSIITHCLGICADLNITALAEGIETIEEFEWLKQAGVELMQGYLIAKPGFESLPEPIFPSR